MECSLCGLLCDSDEKINNYTKLLMFNSRNLPHGMCGLIGCRMEKKPVHYWRYFTPRGRGRIAYV